MTNYPTNKDPVCICGGYMGWHSQECYKEQQLLEARELAEEYRDEAYEYAIEGGFCNAYRRTGKPKLPWEKNATTNDQKG